MFEKLAIADIIAVRPARYKDDRGFFEETYKAPVYHEGGIGVQFVQDNHSYSEKRGTLRGLHFQIPPRAQDKLVYCTRGRILDIAVDIRAGSPDFGRYVSLELSAANGYQLFVPKGFAHAFLTLEDHCEVHYKCSDIYSKEHERGLAFDDGALAIDWPFPLSDILTSAKDKVHPKLGDMETFFSYKTEAG